MSCTRKFMVVLLAVMLSVTPITAFAQTTDQAGTALHEGRRLLKRGQADKALIQLRNALNLYTTAKNNSGMAAAHNELGDLYLRQGQYAVALDHYQKAFDGFFAGNPKQDAVTSGVASGAAPAAVTTAASAAASVADDGDNANPMLAKMGEVHFRLGKTAESKAAYGRMVVKKP